jgi:hypothetical protein
MAGSSSPSHATLVSDDAKMAEAVAAIIAFFMRTPGVFGLLGRVFSPGRQRDRDDITPVGRIGQISG